MNILPRHRMTIPTQLAHNLLKAEQLQVLTIAGIA